MTTTSHPANTTTTTRCLKVVLEAVNGASGISARESVWPITGTTPTTGTGVRTDGEKKKTTTRRPPGGVVNLAGAGRYQNGAGLGKMGKELKKVTLMFGSLDGELFFLFFFFYVPFFISLTLTLFSSFSHLQLVINLVVSAS
jgi:hypothetical protein